MVEKGGGSRQKPKANLDEILGPAPETLTSSAFSFGEDKAGATPEDRWMSAYADGNTDKAIAAWTQAAPMGKDGQAYLNLSQALQDKERFADAKAAAKSALDKGVKKPGVAWQVISISESESGNKAAALAAAREAAKYPETKKWADATIKASGGK